MKTRLRGGKIPRAELFSVFIDLLTHVGMVWVEVDRHTELLGLVLPTPGSRTSWWKGI